MKKFYFIAKIYTTFYIPYYTMMFFIRQAIYPKIEYTIYISTAKIQNKNPPARADMAATPDRGIIFLLGSVVLFIAWQNAACRFPHSWQQYRPR